MKIVFLILYRLVKRFKIPYAGDNTWEIIVGYFLVHNNTLTHKIKGLVSNHLNVSA